MSDLLGFTKGHGTENDFVLLLDRAGTLVLTDEIVRAIADRRAGVGADGIIRVVPTEAAEEPEIRALAGQARWFMDYRNADGSTAQMCGNGARVFAAFLLRNGLESTDRFVIATRAGVKTVVVERSDHGLRYAVDMGRWALPHEMQAESEGFDALVHVDDRDPYSALSVDMGNPHTVVALPEAVDLAALDLTSAPLVNPVPPEGSNVELIRPLGPGHLAMRVHERGVGETRSCGTGACAAAVAMAFWAGATSGPSRWIVDVPGGRLEIRLGEDRSVTLVGPAALVAEGDVDLDSLAVG